MTLTKKYIVQQVQFHSVKIGGKPAKAFNLRKLLRKLLRIFLPKSHPEYSSKKPSSVPP